MLNKLWLLSQIDYGIGLLALPTTQVTKLERIQNEATRTVKRCPRGTPIAAMRYLLNQPTIETRHKCAQVREYIRVSNSKSHPLHKELSTFNGKRIKRGKLWKAEADDTVNLIWNP
jgi:hypothetical protein